MGGGVGGFAGYGAGGGKDGQGRAEVGEVEQLEIGIEQPVVVTFYMVSDAGSFEEDKGAMDGVFAVTGEGDEVVTTEGTIGGGEVEEDAEGCSAEGADGGDELARQTGGKRLQGQLLSGREESSEKRIEISYVAMLFIAQMFC